MSGASLTYPVEVQCATPARVAAHFFCAHRNPPRSLPPERYVYDFNERKKSAGGVVMMRARPNFTASSRGGSAVKRLYALLREIPVSAHHSRIFQPDFGALVIG